MTNQNIACCDFHQLCHTPPEASLRKIKCSRQMANAEGSLLLTPTAQIFGDDVYVNVSHPDKAIKTTFEL